jgi:hypothetical protein
VKRFFSFFKHNKSAAEGLIFSTLGAFLLVYSLYNHYQIEVAWKLSPYLFPVLIAILFVVASIALFIQGRGELSEKVEEVDYRGIKVVAVFTALVFLYYLLLPLLGFIITNMVMLSVFFIFLRLKTWWKVLLLSSSITAVLYVVFQLLLSVRLPLGVF